MSPNSVRIAHRSSALLLVAFILFHLLNHLMAWAGPETHQSTMASGRALYRHPIGATLLLLALLTQIATGIWQLRSSGLKPPHQVSRLQAWSGLYLSFFLIAHPSAIWIARLYLELDTDFYFGAMAFQVAPWLFVPYYILAILAIFVHLGAVLRWMLQAHWAEKSSNRVFWGVVGVGFLLSLAIIIPFLEALYPIELPEIYDQILPTYLLGHE